MFKDSLLGEVIEILDKFFELENGNKITPFNMSGLKNNIVILFDQAQENHTDKE